MFGKRLKAMCVLCHFFNFIVIRMTHITKSYTMKMANNSYDYCSFGPIYMHCMHLLMHIGKQMLLAFTTEYSKCVRKRKSHIFIVIQHLFFSHSHSLRLFNFIPNTMCTLFTVCSPKHSVHLHRVLLHGKHTHIHAEQLHNR